MVVQEFKFIFNFLLKVLMAFKVLEFFNGLDEGADRMHVLNSLLWGCLEVDWTVAGG
jgi:hypothetical protein